MSPCETSYSNEQPLYITTLSEIIINDMILTLGSLGLNHYVSKNNVYDIQVCEK